MSPHFSLVLLAAFTGASRIPPLGFTKKITTTWFDQELNIRRYPQISTCGLTLVLPRGYKDEIEFTNYMEIAVRSSLDCFGHV